MKRIFDILVSASLLVFLAPAFFALYCLVRINLGPPALFRQQRPGRLGKLFTIYKWRTMRDSRDGTGRLLADSARLTRFGRFLRSTSLDELPELWNVLRGDMSLVGPRPLLVQYLDRYTEEQARRHQVRPGITGWAQVNGRNALSWEDRFRFDVWYVDHRSFWLDLRIFVLTLGAIIRRKGINQAGQATMAEFHGSGITGSEGDSAGSAVDAGAAKCS